MHKITLVAALAALGALPAAAVAHPGNGHGPGANGHGPRGLDHPRGPDHPRGRCARLQAVAFVVRGSLVSFTPTTDTTDDPNAGDLVLQVTHANHHAQGYGAALSTAGARVTFRGVVDGNADNAVGFDDVVATDRVMAIGKLLRPKRGCTGDASVRLRKVMVKRAPAPASGQD